MSIVPVPESICSFRDALGLAFELSDEFAFADAVVVTDSTRRCVDFAVERRIGHGMTGLLSRLSGRIDRYPPCPRVLLISVRSVDPLSVYERDLADFRFARRTLAHLGAELLDWIETDGELVRSYAYLANQGTSWSAEAAAEGTVDAADW